MAKRKRGKESGGGSRGSVRRSQVITTYGPGALVDLPKDSAIVGGLDWWPPPHGLEAIDEPRLAARLQGLTGGTPPGLFAPPAASDRPGANSPGITSPRFPEWFLVQDEADPGAGERPGRTARRLVHRRSLDERRRFEGKPVVATRFVRGCPRGHVDDIDWYDFVHGGKSECRGELRLEERGTGGDLSNLVVRCSCGSRRGMHEAKTLEERPLGTCNGARPWLGRHANEDCNLPSRLLIRTATNAWFPQVVTALSLPQQRAEVDRAVGDLWDTLQVVRTEENLALLKGIPKVMAALHGFDDADVVAAIDRRRDGDPEEQPMKHAELDALLAASESYDDGVPVDPRFHARRLAAREWRASGGAFQDRVEAVVQVHRLREVSALAGFTRFEAATPNIDGEYDTDVERADLALEPSWFPAVENRGEGVFLLLNGAACHGCTLVAETSCEMRNDYLDRALVVPIIGESAGFFDRVD